MFFGRDFFCCKIISSETVWMKIILLEKFLDEIVFCKIISSETFWMKKILIEKFCGRKYFCSKIISTETVWIKNILVENCFGRKLFLVENVIVAKSFPRKHFGWKKFFVHWKSRKWLVYKMKVKSYRWSVEIGRASYRERV